MAKANCNCQGPNHTCDKQGPRSTAKHVDYENLTALEAVSIVVVGVLAVTVGVIQATILLS